MNMGNSSVKFRVRYQETDRMGVVYHSNYLVWFEIGRTDFFRKIGVSYAALEGDGYRLLVSEASCKYMIPATYDDEIEVITKLAEFKKSTLSFDYEVRKGEKCITAGHTKHAFIDVNGKIVKMPAIVSEALQKISALR